MADEFNMLTLEESNQLRTLLARVIVSDDTARKERAKKLRPGQFKGKLEIGPEFFEPLADEEISELTGE